MGFLKRLAQLFTGSASASGDTGLYYYVKSHRSGEVIRVRINPMNDLSANDDNTGFFVHKVVVGQRSYERIEMELTFDNNRKLINAEVMGGKLVDEAEYRADQEQHHSRV